MQENTTEATLDEDLRDACLRAKKTQEESWLTLSSGEAAALFDIIDQLSGFSPENVFAWDGSDSLEDTTTRAAAKLFKAAGRSVPEECRGA